MGHTCAAIGVNFMSFYVPIHSLWVYTVIKQRILTKLYPQFCSFKTVAAGLVSWLIWQGALMLQDLLWLCILRWHHLFGWSVPASRAFGKRKIWVFILALSFNTTYNKSKQGFKVKWVYIKRRIALSFLFLCYPVCLLPQVTMPQNPCGQNDCLSSSSPFCSNLLTFPSESLT